MGQNIVKSVKSLVSEANKVVNIMTVDEVKKILNKDDHIIVDLRDIRELKREGKIPGAFSCPRGMLEFWIDPESHYHKEIFNQDKTCLLYTSQSPRDS